MSAHESTAEYVPSIAWQASEEALVHELRAGSVEAFNYLIAIYHQPLFGLMCRMLGNPADAADALQDVFLKIFRAAANFEQKSSLKTWVYRIAVHEASNHRRWWRRHKRQEMPLDLPPEGGQITPLSERLADPGESPLQQAMRAEARRRVGRELEQMPEPYRTVVMLREIEGFGYEEIAEIVGVRVGTVKSRLMRGREILRQRLLAHPALCRELGLRRLPGDPEDKAGARPAPLRVSKEEWGNP